MPDARTAAGPRVDERPPAGLSDVPVATAVVLAGGRPDPLLTDAALPKAFAALRGRPMVQFVLDALRATDGVGRIVIVGPPMLPAAVAAYADATVPDQGHLLDNIEAGLGGLAADAYALVAAADLPLLTARGVAAFLEAARALRADIAYGIVSRTDVLRACPGARKTFVRLRDGVFTGGSLVLLRRGAFDRVRPILAGAIAARKRPWDLARLFGIRTLAELVTGRLRIASLEARAAHITGLRVRAAVCPEPEIALDVDRAEDLAAMAQWLEAREIASRAPGAAGARP